MKRYSIENTMVGMVEAEDGEWVRYSEIADPACTAGWSVRGAEAYRLFTDEKEARAFAGEWGLVKPVYDGPCPVGPQEAVAVKALEWVSDGDEHWKASALTGSYHIIRGHTDSYRLRMSWSMLVSDGDFDAKEEAQAAAQADYSRRIRSALSPSGIDLGGEDQPENTTENPKSWIAWKRRAEAAEAEAEGLAKKHASAWESREFWRVAAEEENHKRKAAEARLATAEKALEPFAKWLDAIGTHGFARKPDDTIAGAFYGCTVTFGDLRRAREALASISTNAVREGDDG